MLAFSKDQVIGRSLRVYGEWAQHELSLLRPHVEPGTLVIDVGANVGTHVLPFSLWVRDGQVVAFEPQEQVASVLQVNCLLNGRRNVRVVQAVCGPSNRRVEKAISDPANVGATRYLLGKRMAFRRAAPFEIPVLALDKLVFDKRISLIKVDAEGMEFDVLVSARRSLRRDRPTVYFEQNNTDDLLRIYRLLTDFGYKLYWAETHPFNVANFRSNSENIWWRTEAGILAIHESKRLPPDLAAVDPVSPALPSQLNAREGICVPEIIE
jgi:FkbM family methyltransferase